MARGSIPPSSVGICGAEFQESLRSRLPEYGLIERGRAIWAGSRLREPCPQGSRFAPLPRSLGVSGLRRELYGIDRHHWVRVRWAGVRRGRSANIGLSRLWQRVAEGYAGSSSNCLAGRTGWLAQCPRVGDHFRFLAPFTYLVGCDRRFSCELPDTPPFLRWMRANLIERGRALEAQTMRPATLAVKPWVTRLAECIHRLM